MTRKSGWRKFGSKGIVLLLSLLLLIGLTGGAFAQTEQPLENYATSIKAELKANAQGEDLPQYVENGQSLFFGLQISNFKSQELVTYLKANPEADFTIPLDFTGHIEGNYPTQINPDDFDNVAYVGGEPLFRWWIDEDSGVIRVRFDENWIKNAGNNTVVENVELGFDGTLNVADKGVDGKLVFKAANDSFPLQMKTGYAITKTAGKPVYRDGQYVVDFTVKLTLDQKMNIVGTADYDGYAALLTLDDTLNANSAMTGEIVDGPSITGANGLTVTAAKNGTANTFSFGGVTELNKGTYTIQFTMKLDSNAAAAKLDGYDKQNTVELKENNASLAKPVKADVSIAWDANVSNQFKVDKAILPQSSTTNVYIDGKDYYVDYIVVVYTKSPLQTFTVVDQIVSNAAHSEKAPTLLGVNTAEGFWNSTAKNVPDNLTQMRADVVDTISGSNRTITVTAPAGDMLPAGAYYLKVPVKVTDSVKTLAEAANKKISANQTQDVTVVYKNKAVLDEVDGDTAINEVSPEVTDTLRAPANFIKRGAIETDSSGNHTIYEKEGLRGKLIRWDVEFSWTIPDQYTVFTDTMKGGQVLLANGSTSFDIWDMSSGKPVEIAKLWNKNDRDYISFGTDANGNETFTFYPGKLSNDPALSTRKFKLTYYTLVPENTVDFTGMKNNWNISYPNPDTGVAIGPVPGEETPIMGDTVKLTMSKVAKDTAYDVHDMYLRWTVTINNSNKIPMSALGDLKLTEDVNLTKKDGVLKNVDFDVWFDPTSRAPELVMYYGASSTITLERGVHYSVAVSAEDDSIMVIDFDEAAMAASLAEVGADRFNKIIMTVYTFNTDYNNVGGHNNSTYPRAHIKNTAKLDYATSGMKQDTIESSSTRGREFTTGMKRTAPLNGEWFADYDNDGEKELRWQLEIGSGSFPKMTAIIKAVDTLPEGQKLKYEGSEWKKNFKVYLKSTSNAIMDVPLADDAFSINGDTFELTINKTQNVNNYYNIFIEYYTVFEDGALQDALEKAGADANDITVPLNNQAILYLDGILLQETDITPDLTINNLAVDKSAKFLQSSGSKVNYTIEMNPYGLDMADGDVILLEDSMGNGKDVFSYIPSSFKLINLDTGAQMSPSAAASSTTYVLKMAEDGKSFTLDVPDNTHLKLTYQVKTTQPVGTQDVSLVNSASLAGRKPQAETITFDVSSAYQSGSFSVLPDEAGIRLVKISSEGADGDAPTFLSGAEFYVTQLDSSFQQVGTVQTMTTDAKGLIEIKEKLTDVVYVVVEETKAPEGYRLGSEPWKWCYALVPAGNSLSDADMARLKETVRCDVTVISAGSYVEDSIINEPVTLTVRKVDENGDLLDGAQFTLRMGDTVIEPDKTHTVAGELRFKNLKAGDYTLAETQAPTGYAVPAECPWNFTLDANGSVAFAKAYGYLALSNDGLYLRVINTPETSAITVKKVWNDNADQDGKRNGVVANVILSKTVDGVTTDIESVKVDPEDDWSYEWFNLPVYEDNKPITYSIREELVEDNGYTSDTTEAKEVNKNGSITITNTHVPEMTSVTVKKIWDDKDNQDGKRPEALTVTLSDGTEVELNERNGWEATIENLPKYEDGEEIVYTWTEGDMPEGYTLTKTDVNGTITTLTNSYDPETIEVSGSKTWDDNDDQDGLRPDSITINLLADGEVIETITVTEGDGWKWSFTALPKYKDQGTEIVYTITEDKVDGYETKVDGFNVTNSYEPETISVEGSKTWDDNNDQDGIRPDSIIINLLADGTVARTITVTEGDGWKWNFTDLPKYKDQGTEIVYTITEDTVDSYKSEVNGFNVTNSYEPETIEVSGSKTWDDNNDQDGLRPDSITINLLADGVEVAESSVTEADGWKWSFTALPKYKDQGTEIVYTITEDTVDGYETKVDGFNVTNSYTPEVTSVEGSKTWDDNNDQDGLRPDSITINLLADGEVIETITVTEGDGWKWSFTDLPKYKDQGTEIVYTITEDTVDGYKSEVNGFDVTNSYTPEVTSVEGSKTWDDNNDQDGLRPDSITINLLADGTVARTATVTEGDGWKWSFTNLPKYKDQGTEIVYTITEDKVDGYETKVNGFDVTNSYTPEVTSVEGSKTWDDNNDQDGVRPDSITINLLADGEVIETITVTEGDGWKWGFTDLPKYKDQGTEIVYTITEDKVDGYETKVDGFNVTNSYTPEVTSVEGSKTWDDNNNQDGLRPDSITINLLADGTVVRTVTVTEGDGGKWSFTDLPKYKDQGTEIVYTITEDTVDGYKSEVNGFDVTNSYEPETISVEGSKTWDDNNDQDGVRPDSITINLLADGEVIETITVTEGDGWKWSFTDLPKYKDQGTEIVYTITEDTVDGYETKVDGFNVTNSYTPEVTSVEGSKTWDDKDDQDGLRPDSIIINLLADGEVIETVTVTEGDGWAWLFVDLPKYKDQGTEIVYTITEDTVDGYKSEVNGFDVTNSYEPETIEVSGSKTWDDNNDQDGVRPDSITINLLADGVEVAESSVTEADGWAWLFVDLPKYKDQGTEIVYTITEDIVDGYETKVDGFNVTNSYTPEVTSVEGSKTWDDNNDQDGLRPDFITINLLADGEVIETITVTEGDGWKWSFTDLPKYKDQGTEIVYTITEDTVDGYKSEVNGFDVTNSYDPETITVEGSKTWDDNNDQDGVRPDSITINLLADGVEVAESSVTETDGWKWSFTDLPKYKDQGTEIVYTITEDTVDGYETKVDGFNVTNSYTPEVTSVEGSKTWDDNNNQDGLRPDSITINLLADGTVVRTVTVTEGDGGKWSFTDLPKYKDQGTEIVYTITEDTVDGYETKVDGFNVTNSYTPEVTSVEGSKTWDDNNDQDGLRPDSITINLLADGTVARTVTVTEADGWKWSFTDLPKYKDQGTEIVYTITEDTVDGYKFEVKGFDVTNSYTPEVTSVEGSKTWDDNNDQDGVRPDSITINLLADGTVARTITVTEGDGWKWSFTNLPKYKDQGTEIVYTITEDTVDGYETKVDGFNVTNSYEPETITVEGSKTWDDNNDQDGLRPDSITINLLADGEVIETITVTEGDGWKWSFTALPKYKDQGTEIVYTITEDKVDGYETKVNGFDVTNSYEPETISVEGSKTWDDNNDQDGLRPDSIIINLLADGTVVRTVTVTEADGWKWSFTDLPKYKNQGTEIVYTITEDTVDGYKSEVNGFDVTNSYDPETITVEGSKTWDDNNDQDGLRPDSITINLLADGTVARTVTVTEGDGWKWSFTDLPKYKDQGTEIVYTITEDTVDGYKSEVNGFNVTNTHEPETVEVTVTKIWNDRGNQGNSRPESLTVALLANEEKTAVTATLNEANGWTETLKDLPKYENGEEIAYSWDEVTVPDGYTISSRVTQNGVTTITNDYAANGSVQFGGTKTLTGTDLQDGQFSFTLTGDGVNETVKNDADGQFQFTEIKYDLDDAGEHTYTVTEVNDGQAGYTYDDTEYEIIVTVADAGDGTLNVTYTVNGTDNGEIVFGNEYESAGSIRIQGQKLVQGEAPEGDETFTFQLKDADGRVLQEVENQGSLIVFEEISYTLADDGKTYVYILAESTESDASWQTDDSEYTLTVTLTDDGAGNMETAWTLEKNGEGAETILFNNIPLNSLTVEKTVVGGDAEKAFAFKVTLADADGKELNGTYPVNGADVSSIASGEYLHLKNGEKAEITHLPVGTKYTVEEDEYIAYTPTVNGTEGRKAEGTITEDGAAVTFVNTEKTVSFSVTKEWQGDIGDAITLTLYGNGEKLNPQPSYNKNGDVYSYENLPQYDADGKTIVYSAKEKYMDGFMTIYRNKAPYTEETGWIYNGGTIINRAVTEFRVQKVWEGLEEGEEIPEITLTLYCNGEAMDKKTPKPDEDGWYVWYNLPIVRHGETAKYSVMEEPVDGFTVTYGEDKEATCAYNGDTIVNRKIPKTGDDSRIGLWLAVTAVSAAGCILLLKKRKKAK